MAPRFQQDAPNIKIPVLFHVQWDDELFSRDGQFELFDLLGTQDKQLIAFPSELAAAAERRAPHRIAAYVLELSQGFTAFYRDCRVVGAEPHETESLRIALSVASKRTIARCLGLLGVHAPAEM